MIDSNAVREQAHSDCFEHAQASLDGELLVDLGESSEEWNPILLRRVFDQPMVIWRRYGELEIILDRYNRPTGFVDLTKAKDCRWESLSEAEIRTLAVATGFVPAGMVLSQVRRQAGGSLAAVFEDPPPVSLRLEVCINPSERAVTSVAPFEGGAS